jgi:hypothetical protein
VLVFPPSRRKPLAVFSTTDHAGSGLDALSCPETIAAGGRRAIVYDSGNQRLMKLRLQGEME